MIEGLPKSISTRVLRRFEIGHQEANRDELLEKCFCDIAPVDRFLRGDKDYLVGVKGTGKSAVFRQLTEHHIEFHNPRKLNQIIVPIDNDIDYLAVRERLREALDSSINDEDVRMRFIWEIYVLYRAVETLNSSDIRLTREDRATLSPIQEYFSFSEKFPSITQIMTKATRTLGVKIDTSPMGTPAPDFYLKSEPSQDMGRPTDYVESVTLNISKIKSRINSIARRNGAVIFILIDNLDDFLAREHYDAQRLVVQGLLACVKEYSKHPYLKLKAFLRSEVFHKVDFEKLGGQRKSDQMPFT